MSCSRNALSTKSAARMTAAALVMVLGALWLVGCRPPAQPAVPETPAPSPAPETPVAAPAPAAPTTLPVPPKSEWKATASDLQEEQYPASNVCDGRADTRWSSPPSDPQWVQVDLGRVADVCGVTILWEDAFSSDYSIQLSTDGQAWTEAYAAPSGDGHTDYIYFRPAPAQFVKIIGTKRGTGWGHSIWELDIIGAADQPELTAPGSDTSILMDGRLDATWTSAGPTPATLSVDLKKEMGLGGVRVDWGENFATALDLYFSLDGSAWNKMGELREGTGNFDLILSPRVMARYLRLDIAGAAEPKPVGIREISLRGPDEILGPLALYQIAAEKAKPGFYPDSLRKRQVYWTLVGLPSDSQESLLDEYGNLEPVAAGSSIMPYLFMDGALVSALDPAVTVTQAMERGHLPLPSVTWNAGALKLTVQALTWGAVADSVTFVRYRLSNESAEARKGRLFLAVRPVQVNPPWQFGGLSNIRSLELAQIPEGSAVRVNGTDQYIALAPPDGFGARPFDQGDIVRELSRGELPAEQKLENAGDLISGALAYDFDLAPGQSRSIVVAAPLHDKKDPIAAFLKDGAGNAQAPDAAFDQRLQELRDYWTAQVDHVVVELPDTKVVDTMMAQVGYIFINRDGRNIQPGSRNYKRSWIRDGSLTSAALLRLGIVEPVRDFLEWYAPSVQPDGLVPPILNNDGTVNGGFGSNLEYDSQGEFIFAILEYYRFTGDREFLQRHYEKVKLAMKYMVTLRELTLAPDYMKDEPARERFVGILPKSYSHEGYSPPVHSYWDDFFALKGWKDGRDAATVLGDTNTAAWAEAEYQKLRASVKASIEATIAFKKINFVPGCAEKGDRDPTSTTIALFPCDEQDILPPEVLKSTFNAYYDEVVGRTQPGWSAGFTPYEVRNVSTFLRLGQKDRANFVLDFLLSCRRPLAWNHLAEVVLADPRMGSYIGDMPHTWVGSGLINSVRGMLARENNGKLMLLAGAMESWVREGNGIVIRNLPTYFGKLALTARAEGNRLSVNLDGSAANPPAGIELIWPLAGKPAKVTVDGADWTDFNAVSCRLPAGVKQVTAEW